MTDQKKRCGWVTSDPVYIKYHDTEWGVPIVDDRRLFEFLLLEGAQAGLSWITVLKKRENYRQAFDKFNAKKIVQYDDEKITQLLNNPGIIRNKLKVNAFIINAIQYLRICEEQKSFSNFIWQFVEGKPINNSWRSLKEVPTSTPISDNMSKALKKEGFKFVGTTICYAFMQAVGMVNDHTRECFKSKCDS